MHPDNLTDSFLVALARMIAVGASNRHDIGEPMTELNALDQPGLQ